jgi:hypothetical protein
VIYWSADLTLCVDLAKLSLFLPVAFYKWAHMKTEFAKCVIAFVRPQLFSLDGVELQSWLSQIDGVPLYPLAGLSGD